jgi:2-isopropylmalate synthase
MANRVYIFDTTLRDGEQSPGCSMTVPEKLRLARKLVELGVDILEAGFPIASEGDFEAVDAVSREFSWVQVAALARANRLDVERAAASLKHAKRPRIHTFLATSDIHLKYKFKKSQQQVLEEAVSAVELARSYTDDVEFSAEDATRTEWDYLEQVSRAVVAAGARTVNLPDTVGFSVPEEYGALIARMVKALGDSAIVSVHCHDDLGLAVANSIAAVQAGARQIECTINGIGERAGNASLEEIVMALRTRRDYFGLETGIDAHEFRRTSRMVADMLGIPVPPNKAVVGSNAFAHSSGIHVDGVLKDRQTYEIMLPEDVGFEKSHVVLTARTGRAGLRDRLEKLRYNLTKEELEQAYQRFLLVADKKQEVYDEDLIAIVHDELHPAEETYRIEYLHIDSGTSTIPTATVSLLVPGRDGETETRKAAAIGDGPVDAVYKAIGAATNNPAELVSYDIRSVTSGTEALGEATVHLQQGDIKVIGRGASTDVIEASARAYIDGLNKLSALRRRQEAAQQQMFVDHAQP